MISLTSPVETRAHGWPAGAKLAVLCAATIVLFAVDGLIWHMGFCAGMLALYAAPGRQFLRTGLRRLSMLWPFVVLVVAWHVLTGAAVEGVQIALRMITAVGLANLVTMTTRLSDMVDVMRWLLTPLTVFGLQTKGVELAVALVIRFTPVLADKGRLLRQSWRARATQRVGWRIILPFAVLAIDDAEHVAEALRARGGL
ncbi:energy-coupling factor transporter transmembrane component T family protein [Sulfitobacter aestuariivivens]|uniref:Energy-coupling factor transporter transmembrane protein EcfT n=1 Tax=Sulfitobacter aestuariivivens TaxID=2766981 RepID=A0A927HGY8_9RHOB|nr:energy-coupling factor transporter transmembrane component T [Sulfitobacter aestuariivivens]MBD3664735.1 energy-coupling factor transporter transmembrane protein EcfT [Sulfitobacter aestuariivivens]